MADTALIIAVISLVLAVIRRKIAIKIYRRRKKENNYELHRRKIYLLCIGAFG